MSLVAFKKKSVIQYGSRRSGKPPGGVWLPQGPFGHSTNGLQLAIDNYGPVGFSINGGHRNVGYVGKTMQMSRNGTPFRGLYPCWTSGGCCPGNKTAPVFNVNRVIVLGEQYKYIKPSVLSTRGMLRQKYRWAYNGQYPNYWVQPNYTGNQTDSASQGLYVQTISAANDCVVDTNDEEKYVGHIVKCGPTNCSTSTAKYKYNNMASNAPYTKTLYEPQTSSQHTLRIQKKCANPTGAQKPFPFAVNGVTKGSVGRTNAINTNIGVCASTTGGSEYYLTPPEWYINSDIDAVET